MKVTTPEISWHERDPIYSVDIQPGCRKIRRLVSGGVDKYVRVGILEQIKSFLRILANDDFCCLLISCANILDPDQDGQNVCRGLDSNHGF